ncbi:restriction endonuclease subunit M [Flavobacterium faecale]|uniref:site-specific DNA-methyltransferase (adenine-specific) n=1 Tax=Flavobacterium faecale TaxID=1355330 RepID=A0A2S1LBF7_9FLAO|nr:TaqI-like C-terminal specificity domain-containing protein [Flavobacterium faecale]AWG21062.1 restriction endonuclease subunit M [Flavobacterium faecale]
MALYQKSVLNKHLKQLEQSKVSKAYKKYIKYFLNPTIQDNIRNSKEEEYQGIFLTELFVNVLDYTLKPNVNFDLVAEYKNQTNSRKADGAILKNEVAVAVIELKGTKTKDLESIRQQAFDYKANQKDCVYVVTSNYEKLRFYINDATEFEEFNLFDLSEQRFEVLYLCLQKDNVLNNIPLKIKEASIIIEEQITKQFYKDYSVFKRELFRDLVKRNAKKLKSTLDLSATEMDEEAKVEQLRLDKNLKLTLFKKSQKLIDRFLFIFFAEDRGLLPPNSTIQILNKWKADVDFGDERPLYDMFMQYFKFLDTGRQGTTNRAEIYAYNGGLFKEDTLLDKLEIDNDLLFKHTQTLASYDFESQVDVNILGHIFENSLNEIESVNAEIEGGDFDKQTSKRKKDGVFYTPKYITKYIVENTIGKLCDEKKNELGFKEEEYFKGRKNRQQNTIVKLVETLDVYREWLLQLTICDPACGSGAFLNQALDFLIKEHNYIDELKAKILGGGLVFSDIENTILENNIFGVDLNEESVEIAKLSLWLRTAQPRRKLNNLNSNIKCGNSLIESKAVAGDKAFNWKEQFPSVFEKGGFDVVIGNPPYVRQELFKEIKPYLEKNYKCYNSVADLYTYFIEKGIKHLIKTDGIYSVIVANKWMRANYAKELRIWLKEQNIIEIIDFKDLPVFADAIAYPCILTVGGNKKSENFVGVEVSTLLFPSLDQYVQSHKSTVNRFILRNEGWSIADDKIMKIISRLTQEKLNIKEFISGKMYVGLKTGLNDAFIIDQQFYDSLILTSIKYKEIVKPYGVGRDLSRYGRPTINKYVICIPNKWTDTKGIFENEADALDWLSSEYELIHRHLMPFENRARKRSDQGKYWWELRACDYYKEFQRTKIVYPEIASDGRFSIDSEETYFDMTTFIIASESKELLGVLNSKLIKFLFFQMSSEIRGGFLRWKRQYVNNLPIPKNICNNALCKNVEQTILLTQAYNLAINKFIFFYKENFKLEKLTKKLENWYELSFADFIKEVNKAIKTNNKELVKNNMQAVKELTKLDEMDWMDVFETKKAEAQTLKQQIDATDREIDAMVYELYGLTAEEIAIVENS